MRLHNSQATTAFASGTNHKNCTPAYREATLYGQCFTFIYCHTLDYSPIKSTSCLLCYHSQWLAVYNLSASDYQCSIHLPPLYAYQL